jgi:O-antigen ligase
MSSRFRRNVNLKSRTEAGVAYSDRDVISAPPNYVLRILIVCFFVFDFPGFTLQLALDPTTDRFVGSPVFALMTLAGNIFVAMLLASSEEFRGLAKRAWPVLAMTGLGVLSATWSINPRATIAVTFRNAGAFYLAIAIVSLMPGFQAIRFAVRTMVLGCLLSLIWVFVFPEVALHHKTDLMQSVHAGLWRGIFSHKQGLGVFAGLTTALLLVYRTLIFPPVILVGAVVCSFVCLAGSASATGFLTMVMGFLIFYMCRFVVRSQPSARKGRLLAVCAGFLVAGIGFKIGLLDPIFHLLGKSSDLTGRSDLWPIEMANFNNSGKSWLGGGLGSGLASDISEWSIDNGYLDMIIDFGYLLAPVLFVIYGFITWRSARLLLASTRRSEAADIFPFAFWILTLIDNITESSFMTKSYMSILAIIAVGLLFNDRKLAAATSAEPARPGSSLRNRNPAVPAKRRSGVSSGAI